MSNFFPIMSYDTIGRQLNYRNRSFLKKEAKTRISSHDQLKREMDTTTYRLAYQHNLPDKWRYREFSSRRSETVSPHNQW